MYLCMSVKVFWNQDQEWIPPHRWAGGPSSGFQTILNLTQRCSHATWSINAFGQDIEYFSTLPIETCYVTQLYASWQECHGEQVGKSLLQQRLAYDIQSAEGVAAPMSGWRMVQSEENWYRRRALLPQEERYRGIQAFYGFTPVIGSSTDCSCLLLYFCNQGYNLKSRYIFKLMQISYARGGSSTTFATSCFSYLLSSVLLALGLGSKGDFATVHPRCELVWSEIWRIVGGRFLLHLSYMQWNAKSSEDFICCKSL